MDSVRPHMLHWQARYDTKASASYVDMCGSWPAMVKMIDNGMVHNVNNPKFQIAGRPNSANIRLPNSRLSCYICKVLYHHVIRMVASTPPYCSSSRDR